MRQEYKKINYQFTFSVIGATNVQAWYFINDKQEYEFTWLSIHSILKNADFHKVELRNHNGSYRLVRKTDELFELLNEQYHKQIIETIFKEITKNEMKTQIKTA